jgi:hypothetical protein
MLRPVTRPFLHCGVWLLITLGCEVSNEDHCAHKAIESDAWCAEAVPDKPFCSPCEAAEHGCVAEQPNAASCPRYSPDSVATGTTGATTSVATGTTASTTTG